MYCEIKKTNMSAVNPLSYECVNRLCGKMTSDQMIDMVQHIFDMVPDSEKRKWHDRLNVPNWKEYRSKVAKCDICDRETWKETIDVHSCKNCDKKMCDSCSYLFRDNYHIYDLCYECIVSDEIDKGNTECIHHVCNDGCTTKCTHGGIVKTYCDTCNIRLCECISYALHHYNSYYGSYSCVSCIKNIS